MHLALPPTSWHLTFRDVELFADPSPFPSLRVDFSASFYFSYLSPHLSERFKAESVDISKVPLQGVESLYAVWCFFFGSFRYFSVFRVQ